MSELENSKKNKRGRKSKYTTEDLKEFIEHYVRNTKVIGQIDASKLARYVEATFGIDFDYRYFNRNKEIKEHIEELNHLYVTKRDEESKEIMLTFNPDKLVDTYRNDPMMLKHHLRGFNTRYEEISERVKEYKDQCLMNKHEIQKLKESIEELKKQNKILRTENKDLKYNVSVLKKFKKFDESIQMLEYLKDRNIIKSTNIETFKAVLSHCKIIEFDEGYSNEDNIDIDCDSGNNEDDILGRKSTSINNIQVTNVINIKNAAKSKSNSKNNIKSHIERMTERLKKD
ncbi:insulinase family protein [Clostridium perfringens]|uniref:insulinase family protein n=1 Tax=Clostridium perfringens TaxID=1502 RepID=UPI0013E3F0A4|nr:insulinase family protein [Clostridium perfringens]ELU5587712.1 hypothetical protein [Clostridium perfringens]MDU3846228.1 insulinase family protein [Clostridium perfringens]NGT58460.1 insulinase family protein [Clostridium perfringens]NGT94756.1 insulinase family protein [Clostridium perfringens]